MAGDFVEWLDQQSGSNIIWYIKRLSANDTLANGTHQAGPYLPRDLMFQMIPAIARRDLKNPDAYLPLSIDSHSDVRQIRAIYYNNKFHENPKGGRNEVRLTNFGGKESALLNLDSTGAFAVFSFHLLPDGSAHRCQVWVCLEAGDDRVLEDRVGPIDPGEWIIWQPDTNQIVGGSRQKLVDSSCWLKPTDMPPAWLEQFPSPSDIVHRAVARRDLSRLSADERLLRRRQCEFQIYQSVEEAIELPTIKAGFTTIDGFMRRAQTILQRRKARSGRSLELHTREILLEEKFMENHQFSHQPESDPGKKPDFLFPSEAAYKDPSFPVERLRMLAVKTTCRDRWRQVTHEAERIARKHLLTLQEGVSEAQFREMQAAQVQLVVPERLVKAFPESVRPQLQTLSQFIGEVKGLA